MNNISCSICQEEIKGSGIDLRLSALTGLATWHRSTTFEHGKICSKCAEELNNLIDNWLLKKGVKNKEYITKKGEKNHESNSKKGK